MHPRRSIVLMSGGSWLAQVRHRLIEAKPPSAPRPRPRLPRWWPLGLLVLAALVVFVVVPTVQRGAETNACAGMPVRIDGVSQESPGHSGHQPEVTVTVCLAAPAEHQYWIMDYVVDDDRKTIHAQRLIDSAKIVRHAYPVFQGEDVTPGTLRTYVVVEIGPDTVVEPGRTWVVHRDDDAPPSATLVSGAIQAPV
jgi:hypothetical protein